MKVKIVRSEKKITSCFLSFNNYEYVWMSCREYLCMKSGSTTNTVDRKCTHYKYEMHCTTGYESMS
jgi:hypothetical protein